MTTEIIYPDATEPDYCGMLLEPPKCAWATYGDNVDITPMFTKDQLRPMSTKHFDPPVWRQRENSCCAFSAVDLLESTLRMLHQIKIRLSVGWVYGHINGQQDAGATLESAMRFLTQWGAPTAGTIGFDAQGRCLWRKRDWAGKEDAAKKEGLEFRFDEIYRCPTIQHAYSALLAGFQVQLGMAWDDHGTDADGWMVANPRRNVGGHAIKMSGIGYRDAGEHWGPEIKNSHGTGFGVNGYGFVPQERLDGHWGFWAGRSVIVPIDVTEET